MTNILRRLTHKDLAAWKTIRLEAVKMYPQAFGGSYEEESVRADEEWLRILNASPVFAYFHEDKIIGVAGYFLHAGIKKLHRATVFTVYVQAPFRGQHIIDKLLDTIAAHAKQQGVEQLHLDVGTYNIPAIACYTRNGFTSYGIDPHAIKLGNEYIDDNMMVKYL